MRVEFERKQQQMDDNLTTTAGLLSAFLGYVAIKDYYKDNPNMINCAVLLTTAAVLAFYTGLKVSLAWQSRHNN